MYNQYFPNTFYTYGIHPGQGRRIYNHSPQSLDPAMTLCSTRHHPLKRKLEISDQRTGFSVTEISYIKPVSL